MRFWHYLMKEGTRVVSKLAPTLSRQSCYAIYRNSNKVRVFCSSLSFQQASADVCASNKSQVIVGFVKTVACNSLENDRCKKKWTKKWDERLTLGSVGRVRGKVSASFAIKKNTRLVSTQNQRVFPDSVSPHKQENECFNRTKLHRKILRKIKKI